MHLGHPGGSHESCQRGLAYLQGEAGCGDRWRWRPDGVGISRPAEGGGVVHGIGLAVGHRGPGADPDEAVDPGLLIQALVTAIGEGIEQIRPCRRLVLLPLGALSLVQAVALDSGQAQVHPDPGLARGGDLVSQGRRGGGEVGGFPPGRRQRQVVEGIERRRIKFRGTDRLGGLAGAGQHQQEGRQETEGF